jgi:cytochrome c556
MFRHHQTHTRYILMGAIVVLGLMNPLILSAHGKATGIVKERMDMMKAMDKQMRSIAAMMKGKSSFDAEKISAHAKSIRIASPKLPALFPDGSLHKPTEALPLIWEEWAHFSALTEKMEAEAAALQVLAVQGDKAKITLQFARLEKTCSGCHSDFREED